MQCLRATACGDPSIVQFNSCKNQIEMWKNYNKKAPLNKHTHKHTHTLAQICNSERAWIQISYYSNSNSFTIESNHTHTNTVMEKNKNKDMLLEKKNLNKKNIKQTHS